MSRRTVILLPTIIDAIMRGSSSSSELQLAADRMAEHVLLPIKHPVGPRGHFTRAGLEIDGRGRLLRLASRIEPSRQPGRRM